MQIVTAQHHFVLDKARLKNWTDHVPEIWCLIFHFDDGSTAPIWPRLSYCWGMEITTRRAHTHTFGRPPWTSDQPDPETSAWQHTTRETNIHTPGGIQTRNSNKRAAADPRDFWDRPNFLYRRWKKSTNHTPFSEPHRIVKWNGWVAVVMAAVGLWCW
jgi:hypothetical protein